MNKYSPVQWSPGGGTTVNKGPACTDRGPSVQVQFFHLKISTLTTENKQYVAQYESIVSEHWIRPDILHRND